MTEALIMILAKWGPQALSAAIDIWEKQNPTPNDFRALGSQVQQESYDWFIQQAKAKAGTPPTQAPPSSSIYDTEHEGTLPPDVTLVALGFKAGDAKYSNPTSWMVAHAGGVVASTWEFKGLIGG